MAQKCDESQRRVLISRDVDDIYSKLKVGQGWLKPDINLYNTVKKERKKDNHKDVHSNERNIRPFKSGNLKQIEAYYINENFEQSSLSLRKLRLNEELAKLSGQYNCDHIHDKNSHSNGTPSHDNQSDCMYCHDKGIPMSNNQNLQRIFSDIKAFRNKYFFECHSADTMLNQKINTIRDANHECQYHFYLNERLFLVPKCSDNFNQTRCSSCYLPVAYELNERLESKVDSFFKLDEMKRVETLSDIYNEECVKVNKNKSQIKPSQSRKYCDTSQSSDKQNGVIDAKISLNPNLVSKDIIIELPVQMSLVVKEKWPKEKISDDVIDNIGVIQLDYNKTCEKYKYNIPKDSYALKYQKGYTELKNYRND